MDALPPNDPNNNGNDSRNGQHGGKGAANQGGAASMDVIGDLHDAPAVVVMFLIGVATWLLRERCVC